jgi:hypothetical protein
LTAVPILHPDEMEQSRWFSQTRAEHISAVPPFQSKRLLDPPSKIGVRMKVEAQGDNEKVPESHDNNGLPDFERSLGTRRVCIAAAILAALCCLACFITSSVIFGVRIPVLLYRSTVTTRVAGFLSFAVNLVLTQCLEGLGYIHATSLRWALFEEERLKFNTNLRLFTSSRRPGPNKWYINMFSAAFQILSYAATSLIFMDNGYPGDPYAYINPFALFALGLALLGQLAIAIWCLRSTALSVPSWSSNPLNTTLAALHFHLQRRTRRCMLSVDQNNLNSVPSLPRDRQRCLLKVTPTIGWILGFVWSLAALAAIWAIAIILVAKNGILNNESGSAPWHFIFNWNVDKGASGVDDLNDIGLNMDQLNTGTSPPAQLVLGILFVFAVQGLQTTGLHCTELLVNMWRDEGAWRAAYVQCHEGCMSVEKKQGGARLKTGTTSSAMFSGPYVFLFLMKALLHWLLGQSISPSIYIAPISSYNLANFETNSTEVVGFAFESVDFEMLYFRLIVYAIVAIIFGIFATTLALWRPNGPQPVTWGHLQTLADLIDDWTVDEDGDLWWGDKGSNHEGIRHAGTSAKKIDLGEIVIDAFYDG